MRRLLDTPVEFWSTACLTVASLLVLCALAAASGPLYQLSNGRFPAMLIAVMRSREVLDNPGVTGYYERLLAKTGRMDKNYIFDGSFRIFRFKPNLTWKQDGLTTNSFGMIGPERSLAKPPNTRRIALLGGSLSSGHMLQANKTYGALLENRLNRDRPNGNQYEVLNFACIAYTLPQMLDVAEEDVPRFHPDVFMVDVNELAVFRQWDRQLVQLIQAGTDPKYDFLRSTLRQAGVSRDDDTLTLYGKLAPYRIPVLRWVLTSLKESAEKEHAGMIVILLPAAEAGDASKRRVAAVGDLLTQLHVPIVDVLDTFDSYLNPAQLAIYSGDVHPNAKGHQLIYENLYKRLQAQPDAWSALVGSSAENGATRP